VTNSGSVNIPPVLESHPLSFGQQGLSFLHEFDPESVFYNIITTWRFRSRATATRAPVSPDSKIGTVNRRAA